MSAWDEVKNNEKGPDSRGPDSRSGHEPPVVSDHVEDIVEAEVKPRKKGPHPRLVLALFGALILGIVGFFGYSLASKLSKPGRPPAPVAAKPAVPLDGAAGKGSVGGSRGTVLMDGVERAPAAAIVGEAASAAQVPIGQNTATRAPLAGEVAPLASTAAATLLDRAQAADPRFDEVSDRITSLERSVATLTARMAAPAPVAPKRSPVAADAATVHARHAVVAGAAGPTSTSPGPGRAARKPAAMITELADEVPPEISRLQLRGVFPPTGADMQAWVVDGDKTISVSKDSVINGARVVRVEPDRVVTTRGVIR